MSEITFYEDNIYMTMSKLPQYDRSKLQLDFNNSKGRNLGISPMKRNYIQASTPGSILQSPDLKMLKLASPELEKLIIQNNGFITTTPTPTTEGNANGGKESTTAAQEQFARGFIEALQKLHEREHGPGSQDQDRTSTNSTASSNNSVKSATWKSDINENTVIQKNPSRPTSKVQQQPSRPVATAGIGSENQQIMTIPGRPVAVCSTIFPHANISSTGQSSFSSISTTSGQLINLTNSTTSTGVYSSINTPTPSRTIPKVSVDVGPRTHNTFPGPTQHSNLNPISTARPAPDKYNQLIYPNTSVHQALRPTIKLEDGAQVVPSGTPPIVLPTPINLEVQEIVKHERKKLRNRLAAQRCRRRKIEREDVLKDKVKELKNTNSDLNVTASELRMQVCELKQKVMEHVNQGCQVFRSNGSDFTGLSLGDSQIQFNDCINVEHNSATTS